MIQESSSCIRCDTTDPLEETGIDYLIPIIVAVYILEVLPGLEALRCRLETSARSREGGKN